MRAHTAAGWSLLLSLAAGHAAAQQPGDELEPIAQEFFITETVYPQDAGEVQLTADSDFEEENLARLTVEYGITDHLQVSATTPPLRTEGSGSEWSVGALFNLVNRAALAASVSLDAEFQGADEKVVLEPAFTAARQMGIAQVHGSVAAALGDETEYSSGLGLMLDEGRFTPTLELTATGQEHVATTVGITPGIYLHLGPHAEFGIAAPVRLHGDDLPPFRALLTVEF